MKFPRWGYRCVLSCLAGLCTAAVTVSVGASAALATPADALPRLSVTHNHGQRSQITDPSGRTVILRGVNVVGLEDDVYLTGDGQEPDGTPFWPVSSDAYAGTCPQNSHMITEPPVCEVQAGMPEYHQSSGVGSNNDLAQMRSLGFNFIRLAVSWSQLEPKPGAYSATYINRIAQVVGWAREQGIYVLLDMHGDNYSRFTPQSAPASLPPLLTPTTQSGNHADGAPSWAVMGNGVPALAVEGQGELNAYAETAFTNFWLNRVPTDPVTGAPLPQGEAPGPGLQDHYIGAMAELAKRFKTTSTVAGYEIMNEPLPGLVAPGAFDQGYLYPFYRRSIDALTGVRDGITCPSGISYPALCGYRDLGIHDSRHLFFFEPMAARNLTDFAVGASLPFSSYPNLVYAPHVYTHVFTLDTQVPGGVASSVYPLSYDQAMTTAGAEARAMGAALFIGEYGNSNSDDTTILGPQTTALDKAMVGSTLWSWKANCGPGQSSGACGPGLWSMYYGDSGVVPAQNGSLIPSRVEYVSRVYPRATAGTLLSFGYDPDHQVFAMSATSTRSVTPGTADEETEIYIPPTVPGVVRISGAAVLAGVLARPDLSRLALVAPTGHGAYGVTVG